MRIIKNTTVKGFNIYLGNDKRALINKACSFLNDLGYSEIQLPIVNFQEIFENKVGEENNNMMYTFSDRGNRELCLAPEYTSIVMRLAEHDFKYQKDVKLYYVAECFRGENPQKGRFRQFTQFGVEILNPRIEYNVVELALTITKLFTQRELITSIDVSRGLDYYEQGQGFEIRDLNNLQLVGGGKYPNGIGFAIGLDRIITTEDD